MSKWTEILGALIHSTGISKYDLHNEGKIDRNALNTTLRQYHNPGIATIETYLTAFGLTWDDWAKGNKQYEKGKTVRVSRKKKKSKAKKKK